MEGFNDVQLEQLRSLLTELLGGQAPQPLMSTLGRPIPAREFGELVVARRQANAERRGQPFQIGPAMTALLNRLSNMRVLFREKGGPELSVEELALLKDNVARIRATDGFQQMLVRSVNTGELKRVWEAIDEHGQVIRNLLVRVDVNPFDKDGDGILDPDQYSEEYVEDLWQDWVRRAFWVAIRADNPSRHHVPDPDFA